MQTDDYGNEFDTLHLDEETRDEYALSWCLSEAQTYIERHGIERFLHELRVRLEQ
tara:strand:+ start:2253 stop:2417 length:165 start_codon:yes stop_codon:yes gene_type:complete